MKNQLLIGLTALMLIGCSSTSVYRGVITLTQVRDSVMKELALLNKQKLIDNDTFIKIDAADLKYRIAAGVAEKALVAYKNGGSQADYLNSLLAVRVAISELINILRPLNAPKAATAEVNLTKATEL